MRTNQAIRVMVVDDSMLARNVIIKGLSAYPEIQVVGFAINTIDAQNKIPLLHPDVITMDVEMPGQSGIDFLKEYLPQHALPVIVVSSLDIRVFNALNAGAVDFVRKPDGMHSSEEFIDKLAKRVIVASTAKVRRAPNEPSKPVECVPAVALVNRNQQLDQMVIALGASTGGTEATLEIMRKLPENIPGMVIVQHMPAGFTKMYAERLNRLCAMEVREAVDGDEIRRGLALLAPGGLQMSVIRNAAGRYAVSCTQAEKVSGHRPSVDVLFQSVADTVRAKTVGIILTGMGQDGAEGLLAMRNRGAYTIGQDQESSVVYGMPMVAHKIGAVQKQASCEQIGAVLLHHLNSL